MNQLALNFALSRRRDPETSKRAACNTEHFRSSHEGKIYGAIIEADGLNYREIARITGMEPVAVARRLGAMGERRVIKRKLKDNAVSATDFIERDGCALWWRG